jgi:hypothetical protein
MNNKPYQPEVRMSVTNHIESIWIGSCIPVIGQTVTSLPMIAVVDYSMLFSLIATGMGLIGMKAIELYKNWRIANKEIDPDHDELINCNSQLVLQKQNFENIIKIKDLEISTKDKIIENLQFIVSTLTSCQQSDKEKLIG